MSSLSAIGASSTATSSADAKAALEQAQAQLKADQIAKASEEVIEKDKAAVKAAEQALSATGTLLDVSA